MTLRTAFILLFASSYVLAVEPEYLMVELEPEFYERNIVKRQAQYVQDPRALQYTQQPAAEQQVQQVTPEYYNYLQQVQAQQLQAQQLQAQQLQGQQGLAQTQGDIQQALSNRAPQRFLQQRPPRPPPVPEDQRRLQEAFAQRQLRDQEREDQTNQQLISIGLNPGLVRRQQLRESAARLAAQQAEEQAARQALQAAEQHYQQLYGQQQQVVQPQLVQVPQEIPVQQSAESAQQAPERFSYSQVAFGSTQLPQQRILPGRTQLIYTQPQVQPQHQAQQQVQPVVYRQQEVQAQPQQVLYQPQLVYKQEQEKSQPQQVLYSPQSLRAEPQLVYTQQAARPQAVSFQPQVRYVQPQPQPQQQRQPQAEVTQKQHPEQYLIETTKQREAQQQVTALPRKQQFSYRPQANYQELQAALAGQRQRTNLIQQQIEASTTPAPRSSIFVTTRTPVQKTYSLPEYRLQKEDEKRPLTQAELNALINAGFTVTPTGGEQNYAQEYYRGLAKRQNIRPRIGRVPLSEAEREVLAKNGIRSLYRVQTAETQDAPVTYVLAIENQKRDTEKSTST